MKQTTIVFLLLILLKTGFSQEQTVGLFENDYRSFNGYTLFSPMRTGDTYLIDNCGFEVHSWTSQYRPNNSVYLLENGNLLQTCAVNNITGIGGRLEIMDWGGNLTWQCNFPDSLYRFHHDIEPLPNGNILIISWDEHTPDEALEAGRNPANLESIIYSEKIIEVQPFGQNEVAIVWEWKAWDHLIQDFDENKDNFGVVADHPELFDINYSASTGPNANTDWLHFNGIDYNAELDQILLCSRNQCEFYVIDHSTTKEEAASHNGGMYGKGGDILYRFGNPIAYERGTISDRLCFFQHDAAWIETGNPDAGKILFFNNQYATDTSAICMVTPPQDSAGYYTSPGTGAYGPEKYDWVYASDDIYAPKISSAQQMPNGNVVICAGPTGQFREVDINKNRLWKYINPVGNNGIVSQGQDPGLNNVFKIYRYSQDYPGLADKVLEPIAPVELNPWPSGCDIEQDTMINLSLKVFLEGPFHNGSMAGDNSYVPLEQPFNSSPWEYPGTEAIQDMPPGNFVDWVMIELRDAAVADSATSSKIVMQQAALLKSDGTIVSPDGSSDPEFFNSIKNGLFIVIHQRNHLSIMSSVQLKEGNSDYYYDFTDKKENYYGGEAACKDLGSGYWGMASGDANADRSVDMSDLTGVWEKEAGLHGYDPGDFNNDGQVENTDKDDHLIYNLGKISHVPE